MEDAACEPASTSASAGAGAGSPDGDDEDVERQSPQGPGEDGIRTSISGLSSSLMSEQPRGSTSNGGGSTNRNLPNPNNASNGHASNPHSTHDDNAYARGGNHIDNNVSSDVVIAEKLDSRSISLCGRHGRLQRWHCAVVVGLLLVACVVIPTAVVFERREWWREWWQ